MPIIHVVESESYRGENRGRISVGVIGWPVGHTVSPAMHEAAARAAGVDLAYGVYEVHPDDLGSRIAGIRALRLAGVNVTIPHKIAVAAFLDEIEPSAREIGAVNCIANRGGTLRGHDFDSAGFARSLARLLPGLEPARSVVFGAGGSARAVVHALLGMGSRVAVWSRDESRAQRLASELGAGAISPVSGEEVGEVASEADLVVNCTPLGMRGGPQGRLPIDCGRLGAGCVVYDLVYNPLKTPLLAEAEDACLRGINGLWMLAEQAALSFELWTGQKASAPVMEEAARAILAPSE
jgi:shikimate dehydrogenase